jgi:cystathionine gamma-synthase/methionine-gamma-lyase
MKLDTLAVHAGDRKKLGDFVPVTTPIYGASSYIYERTEDLDRVFADEKQGQTYARYGSTTTNALEEQIAALEGAEFALASASGMASLHLALLAALTDRRRSIVAANVLFGQSFSLLMKFLEPTGVSVSFADPCDIEAFEAVVAEEKPACILVETVSNPLLRVPPLDKVIEIARRHNALTVVDATFTTPILLRPMLLGADFVVHSSTKYLSGHGDALGGILVTRNEFRQVVQTLSRTLGSTLGSFEAYLTMRGVKTLALRLERQCQNACRVASALKGHPRVEQVHFPGDPLHPDADAIRRLVPRDLYGAMVSFAIKDAGREQVFRFNDALQLVVRATSWGDVHTLIRSPTIASHRELAPKHRERLGSGDNRLRLSGGLEAAEASIADLAQARERG